MKRLPIHYRAWIGIIAGIACSAFDAVAQPPGTITADPNAVVLRKIWEVKGNIAGGDQVGLYIGGVGDILGTGYGVWYVFFGKLGEERYYVADSTGKLPSWTEPFYIGRRMGNPIVGDFWGTGHNALLFRRYVYEGDTGYFELHAFRTDSNRIHTEESATLNTRLMKPEVAPSGPQGTFAIDIDRDGADELVLGFAGLKRGGTFAPGGEIWIFKGGPDFQLDTPTVIIQGPDLPAGQKWYAMEDFDGDRYPDIVMTEMNRQQGNEHLYFFWGDGTLEGFNDPAHHRIIQIGDGDLSFSALDSDGDHIADIVLNRHIPAAERGAYLFRSGTGKSAHTRSYQIDDADLYFRGYSGSHRGGYVNDTAQRYELMWINTGVAALFNGGPNGPDVKYDAWIDENTYGSGWPIMDVDGDGWDDYIAGNSAINFNGGAAAIFAGGPYIPRDASLGVEDIAVAGVSNAISLWPNPAHDALHIAWRGDLKRMPRRFVVHDMLGREVASGEVAPGTAAAVWQCADVPSGIYLVSIHDAANMLLTTARIVKQ